MSKIDIIRARLATLEPESLEIFDDSHQHLGHGGYRADGSHFRMAIVSAQFADKSKVARHRMVYAALGELMKEDIHAMNIDARTPAEATVS
ncbi:MAG: BolA family transcriptional regulator [Sterolibacterium sp.]|nr:BolA family transcriptional regulator [Sterolibacterium sp.]